MHRFVIALVLVVACGGSSSSSSSSSSGGADGGSSSGTSGGTGGGVTCYPGDSSRTLACPTSQMCVDDYAGAGGLTPKQQCKDLPAACANDHTCACVTKQFKCGITTTCDDAAGDGLVRVTCQPD